MDADPTGRTSVRLLLRLRQEPGNQAAWEEFVRRYAPLIYHWCRRGGAQEADAQDVTQDVLLILAREMRSFVYDPQLRFRGWLRVVTRNALGRYLARRERAVPGVGGSDVFDWLGNLQAREDLVRQMEDQVDRELLAVAMESARGRVAPATWEAFRLTAVEGLSGVEAARRLGIRAATVYVARGRVQKIIQEEVATAEVALDSGDLFHLAVQAR